tara:strand:+ start:2037 stop:4601 length:2565 start_codon:yes stop_codon:yes gene_type:complete
MKVVLLALWTLCHLSVFCIAELCVSSTIYNTLHDIYNSLDGANWQWKNASHAWNFSSDEDPCQAAWEGVTCSPDCNVTGLALKSHGLQGQVPYTLSNLNLLKNLDLSYNQLSGSVPEVFSGMFNLTQVAMEGNMLASTLPSSINNLTKLIQINFRDNKMIGELNTRISSLNLTSYLVDRNRLSGSIPVDAFSHLKQLQYFSVWQNRLTGTLPPQLGQMSGLQYMGINNNSFHGIFPVEIAEISGLIQVWMNDNNLEGTLPRQLASRKELNLIMAHRNAFSGTLDGVFDAAIQTNFADLDISNNRFSGQLPDSLFELPLLATFSATGNCFSGSIPSKICDQTTLENLVLDGLSTAEQCGGKKYLGVTIPLSMEGSLPSCIWKLPRLRTLHAAANNFQGSITKDSFNQSTMLNDVVINRNKLTGQVPEAVFQVPFKSFDLSFNKLSGVLSGKSNISWSENSNIVINNNRLSGSYDANLLSSVQNLQMLEGNLFACREPNEMKITNDPYYYESTTKCGSYQYDFSLIFYGCVVFAIGLVFGSTFLLPKKTKELIHGHMMRTYEFACALIEFRNAYDLQGIKNSSDLKEKDQDKLLAIHTYKFGSMYYRIVQLSAILGLLQISMITVVFPALKSTLKTGYTHQYAWVWSAVLTFGSTCAILLLLTWMLVALYVSLTTYKAHEQVGYDLDDYLVEKKAREKENQAKSSFQRLQQRVIFWSKCAIIVTPHLVVIMCVNLLYVHWTATVHSKVVFFFIEIFMVAFELLWCNFVTSRSITHGNELLYIGLKQHQKIAMLTFLSIFATILGPMVASAISDSNCFSDALNTRPTVVSVYPLSFCGKFDEVLFVFVFLFCSDNRF